MTSAKVKPTSEQKDAQSAFVRHYHERTKHQLARYANGPDGLDWDSQPNPFREFSGAPLINLPLGGGRIDTSFQALYTPNNVTTQTMELTNIATLFELAFGLSAWKQYGTDRWALRCNPSSGNLHPTEAYLITPPLDSLAAGVYHYLSRDHVLEHRCVFPENHRASQPWNGLLVGLSSVHWREAWKYGERAFRYCQHDIGHAIAALRYAAATLGWHARLLDQWSDEDIATALGLTREQDFIGGENETPDVMIAVTRKVLSPQRLPRADTVIDAADHGRWLGHANHLSAVQRQEWPIIDEVTRAAEKPRTLACVTKRDYAEPLPNVHTRKSAVAIIKQRRSAQAFDQITSISSHTFYRLLDATLARERMPPWDVFPWRTAIHLVLFVHRVDGVTPGLYALTRHPGGMTQLRNATRAEFQWQRVTDAPAALPLFSLIHANCQRASATLSCHQRIASDGVFSIAMLAEFDSMLNEASWCYRRLFWEAGILGQSLYLEAEAAGIRGTGIGCYFDDAVHETLGLKDSRLQSIYHFTVGGPLNDERITTLPAYAHLGVR